MQMLNDSCIYRVRNENFNMLMFFYGIDTDSRCNYRSKVNFVHFIWDYFERFSIRKFAITLLPKDSSSTPLHLFDTLVEDTRLLYLRYYRAASDDWWKDRKIVMNVSSEIVYPWQLFRAVVSLTLTAHVLYANDNLPPYVT